VHYINKQGGTRSAQLCYLTWDLLLWCIDHKVSLRAVHLAGTDNGLADLLSRKQVSPLEWQLDKGVVKQLFGHLGRPLVDLFASSENAQLPTFCSWRQDPGALATDALSISWVGLIAYAYPPLALLLRVLNKIEEEGCKVILIAPVWPRRHWYVRLLQLLCESPILLPDKGNLLTQHNNRMWHPNPQLFKLAAWPLSGVLTDRKAFLEPLPSSSLNQSDLPPELFTSADSKNLHAGVVRGKRIPFRLI
jgi:hypothetical protein